MRISTAGTVAALAATVSAFADTAPFILYTSDDVSKSFETFGDLKKPIVAAEYLPTFNCPPVDHVLILTHYGVNAADFQGSNFAPLKSAVKSAPYSIQVPEVTGNYPWDALVEKLQKQCGFRALDLPYGGGYMPQKGDEGLAINFPEGEKTVLRTHLLELEPMSVMYRSERGMNNRKFMLAQADTQLLHLLQNYEDKSYMVLYIGSPAYSPPTDSSSSSSNLNAQAAQDANILRVQSRRDSTIQKDKKNSTMTDHRPLFEKYQFFTPGLFMGLLVTLLLLSILFVALRAISSLEVSYAAFEKEMGPQKKAQ